MLPKGDYTLFKFLAANLEYASANKLKWSIDAEGNSESLLKGKISDYESVDILTFRKNPMRNADFGGVVKGTPDTVEIAWKFDTYLLLSGKTQITYKSLRNSLYIGNSAFFFEIQAPLIK